MWASASGANAASAMRSGSVSLRFPNRVMPAPAIQTSVTRALSDRGAASVNVLGPAAVARVPSTRRRVPVGHVDAELPHEAQEIGALEPEGARGARAVALELEQRGLDEPPLELGHRPVEAGSLLAARAVRRRAARLGDGS